MKRNRNIGNDTYVGAWAGRGGSGVNGKYFVCDPGNSMSDTFYLHVSGGWHTYAGTKGSWPSRKAATDAMNKAIGRESRPGTSIQWAVWDNISNQSVSTWRTRAQARYRLYGPKPYVKSIEGLCVRKVSIEVIGRG